MVYCGKPSRGCQMCRTRRIKCDETKPTCNQCLKSRRQCPGYKDEFDLVFRNETLATERRAKRANKKALALAQKSIKTPASPAAPDKPLSPLFGDSSSSSPRRTSSLMPSLGVPLDDQASCHFVSNFVLIPKQNGCSGFLDFVPELLKSDATSRPLLHAFRACSFAAMGNRYVFQGRNMADIALGEYTKALQAVHLTLAAPGDSSADSTLAAVLLLGLFENITAKHLGMLAWGSHTEGAIQMVKNRGMQMRNDETGLRLFIAVRTQMIIHTISSGTAPIFGVEWWLNAAVKNELAAESQRLMIRTSELRAEVTRRMSDVSRCPENIEIMLDMIRRAQRVDQECIAWFRSVPEPWRFKTVAWEDNVPNGNYARAEVFPGRVDVYQDFWTASVWNNVRVSRIILASVTVRCAAWVCSPVDYRTTPEYATAARICVDTITDIIASVPYHLGWHLKKKHVLDKIDLTSFACGEENSQKMLAGYFLTWPLACIYGQDYTTDAQRQWVCGRLKYVGDEMGIKYAHILSALNVRLPSMLIRRDGLLANPYPMAQNFERLVSARFKPAPEGQAMNPLQQREAMQKKIADQQKADLLSKAMGSNSNASSQWVTHGLLSV